MICNVRVLYKIIFSNKFGFILESVFSYSFDTCRNATLRRTSANDLTVKVLHNLVKSWVLNHKFMPEYQNSGSMVFLMARMMLVVMAVAPKNCNYH